MSDFLASEPPLEGVVAAMGAPATFGDYVILEHIADGGMSQVYAALQPDLDRIVALKLPKPDLAIKPILFEAFLRRDVQTLASLEHPHITRVYAGGVIANHPYLAMELLAGNLADQDRSANHRTPRQAAVLVAKLAHAVQYSHARGVLHCDIKPSNVLFDDQGEPRLSDFGLSQNASTAALQIHGGSRGWMAPEQVASRAGDAQTPRPTVATDVFALGALLFWLTKGDLPFGSDADFEERALTQPRSRPRAGSDSITWAIDAICYRALQATPERRYASAGDMAMDLERALRSMPVTGYSTPRWRKALLWLGTHRMVAQFAAFLLLLFIAGSILVVIRGNAHEQELQESALRMHELAARGQAARVLYELRQAADLLQDVAANPLTRHVAQTGQTRTPGAAPEHRCDDNAPMVPSWVLPSKPAAFDVILVLDNSGCPRAREPFVESSAYPKRWFGWRNYFREAEKLGVHGQTDVHVGFVFRSTINREIRFSLSTPVYAQQTHPVAIPEWVGVATIGLTVNATLAPIGTTGAALDEQVVALLGPFEGDAPDGSDTVPGYTMLAHPALHKGGWKMLPQSHTDRLHEHFGTGQPHANQFALPTTKPISVADYVDPFLGGRWLAAFAPVGHTGHVVVVQTRFDAVVSSGARFSRNLLVGLSAGAILAFVAMAMAFWWDILQRRKAVRDFQPGRPFSVAPSA